MSQLARTIAPVFFTFASLLAPFQGNLARPASTKYSPAIQTLLKEAQSGKSQPIEINRFTTRPLDPFQGAGLTVSEPTESSLTWLRDRQMITTNLY